MHPTYYEVRQTGIPAKHAVTLEYDRPVLYGATSYILHSQAINQIFKGVNFGLVYQLFCSYLRVLVRIREFTTSIWQTVTVLSTLAICRVLSWKLDLLFDNLTVKSKLNVDDRNNHSRAQIKIQNLH